MTQDIYKRIQRLIENYQGTSMVKRAQEDDVKEEMMEHAVVPEQAVEPGEFSKEMDRILAEYLPSSVAAKDELDEDEAVSDQEDIQEQSPATTDVSMADEEEEESAEPESPLAVGEEAEEQLEELKSARKAARKLSDSVLINEFRNATKEIVNFLSALEKSAAFTGVVPMVPPGTPLGLVSGIMKQAQTDADLVAAQMAEAQTASPEEVERAADEAVDVVDEVTDELAEDILEVLDDVAEEIDEVVTQVEEELREQGQPEAAEMVRPIAVQAISTAFGVPVEEAGVPLAPTEPVPAETEGEEEEEEEGEEEEKEESEEKEVAEEVAELSDEETVNELGNAMEDLGLTPEELVEEAKDKEARKSAALIAQAVKHLKMARRFKRTAAVYEKHRKIRNAMKNYLLELIN